MNLRFASRHLGILTFDFIFGSVSVTDGIMENVDPESTGVAAGVLFLASLEVEIHRPAGYSFTPTFGLRTCVK